MLLTTLVLGPTAAAREAAIAGALVDGLAQALILEGLPDGKGDPGLLACTPAPSIDRIAPGCLCCGGQLVLRVTLNRVLRRRPARLFIGLANTAHLATLRMQLCAAPYDSWLTLSEDLCVGATRA